MNFLSHFTFGIFTALLGYYFFQDVIGALVLFFVQTGLILDFLFKKLLKFEPLHTVLAMIVAWLTAFFAWPAHHLYVIVAYGSHLFLDLWVHEEIPLLWPLKTCVVCPIKNAERFTILTSFVLSVVIAFLLFLRYAR